MALPSRPNARVGLPANPRSRSLARRPTASVDIVFSREDFTRDYIPSRQPPAPPSVLQIRPTRSLADMRSGPLRSRSVDRGRTVRPSEPPPPLPIASSAWHKSEPNPPPPSTGGSLKRLISQRKRTDGTVTSWGSNSSSGSSASGNSLRSYTSFASSQTSLADDDIKAAKSPSSRSGTSSPAPVTPGSSPSAGGSSIWNRVTNAAGNLKVNVNKAIGAAMAVEEGESTPDGQESSLSRAMKAYHVEKANGDAQELPDWLFEGRDREIINRLRAASDRQRATPVPRTDTASPAPERGRTRLPAPGPREVSLPRRSESAASTLGHSRPESVASVHATVPSRDSMNRLKELRIAKRNARVRFEGHDDDAEDPIPSRAPSRTGSSRPAAPPSAFREVPLPEPAPLRRRPTGYNREPIETGQPDVQPRGDSLARRPTGLPVRSLGREGRRSPEDPVANANASPLMRRPAGLPARAPSREGRRVGLPGNVRPQRI